MNLKNVLSDQTFQALAPIHDDTITGISFHSKHVQKGHLFVAISTSNIQHHIQEAINLGAKFILKDKDITLPDAMPDSSTIFIDVLNTRLASAHIAATLHPGQPETVVAVTGTNGKTSVTHFLKQIWALLGLESACIGTTGIYGTMDVSDLSTNGLTSPDPMTLHTILSNLHTRGCTHVALEASSHGLDQQRMDCLTLSAAGFTNLTHDHLDYHGDLNGYYEAKERLFNTLLPEGSGAVLNADDFRYHNLLNACRSQGHRVITFGRESHDIQLVNVDLHDQGQDLKIKVFGKIYDFHLPLVGVIQSYNVLCALGLAMACNFNEEDIINVLPRLQSVPGRFEWVGNLPNHTKVFVDFAHTPHAIETVLTSLKPHAKGSMHLVMGCGGNRDKTIRPLMGQIAQSLADYVYVTDDNPRSEDPNAIRKAIMEACPQAKNIGDRRKAITTALENCKSHDICIIAGKGHEQNQTIGQDVFPFDDRVVAREEIKRLQGTVL